MKKINTLELFAGAGGLALGLSQAGFSHIALNENNKDCLQTLHVNKPEWTLIPEDIHKVSFQQYYQKADMVSGGFPCQAFSYSGKRLGFEDTRGTLFYEFARCILETQPTCFLAENVKGLLTHDSGKTIQTILQVFSDLNYHVFSPILLNAHHYDVAQKRERIFIFGVQKKLKNHFHFEPPPQRTSPNLKDIFFQGAYYSCDVDSLTSQGAVYSEKKKKYFELIPEGGNWKNLSTPLQKEYLGSMFQSEGGKTGILKKLSYEQPSVTLLTNPSQKQTERCHPQKNRPLNIREYARIQSFPDDWKFIGSIASQYKQIGNAVPVLLAKHLGQYLFQQLNPLF
jgi:DNA (cytosine-5)-methyltransferase 1